MKIGIIGATGQAGRLIMETALERGHEVTAIVRHPERLQVKVPVIQKDLYDLNQADLADFDVVVDAFKAPQGAEDQFITSIQHLIRVLSTTDVKLFVVGGAGSLYVDDHITHLYETPDFPDAFKPTAIMMSQGLEVLENQSHLNWTYISPAADFQADGPQKGHYQLGNEILMTNDDGQSAISYADYAQAMLDVIESNEYDREHLSVIW